VEEDIKKCLEELKKGGVILYPTDTIWGLGCDATNKEAVAKIYEIKQRFDNQTMILLVNNDAMIERFVADVPEVAYQLIEFAEKPLTIILENALNIADNLLGENRSVGIRVTKEAFTQKLIGSFRKPIVSTSANIHNQAHPAYFAKISEELKSKVDYIVTYRQNETKGSKPSSIISLKPNGEFKIIRE